MIVGIQESEHFEGVYPVIRLFDNGQNQLYIFVNAETRHRLLDLLGENAGRYHWIIQEEHQTTASFCRTIRRTILDKDIQLLYLNTISKHHIWYALFIPFMKIRMSVLTVHDVNCLFKDKPGLSPRSWIKWLGKKLLTRRIKAFNTVSETVRPYLSGMAKKDQQVFIVPGAIYEQQHPITSPTGKMRIVIPGSIDAKRRDYKQVFDLLAALSGFPVEIILLGGGTGDYAKKIWQQCQASAPGKLIWFEQQVIVQKEFDRYLDSAHFIWVPSVIETSICGSIPETYGITKSSGNIFDIIKHAKPFFYPEALQIPDKLKSSGVSYSDILELVREIQYYSSNPDSYIMISASAKAESGNFTVDQLRKSLAPLFGP